VCSRGARGSTGAALAATSVSPPLQFATYFDRHYLTRGLALYWSLVRHCPPFVLRVLCLDDETYQTLSHLRLDHLALTRLVELERADPELLEVKPTRQPVEYYWTCGPAYLQFLLTRHPQIGALAYLDADLYCFSDPTPIFAELGSGSILLVHHRWPAEATPGEPAPRPKGTYNVGLLVFRRSAPALACLRDWRERCLEWCFDRVEPGRFGDQKYLDEWPDRFEGVGVSQLKGAGLGPWSLASYRYSYHGPIIYVDSEPLMFYHFQGLRAVTRWLYDPAWRRYGRWMHPNAAARRWIYVPYVRELRAAQSYLRAAGVVADPCDTVRSGERGLRVLARMVRRRRFLIVTDTFAL
jgi:hypothetical protein